MLNKEQILEIMEELDLSSTDYWIVAGSALVMHDIKEWTNDIDLGCTTKLFEELALDYYEVKVNKDGTRRLKINDMVEVFENWNVDKIEIIDGLPVVSIESIKKQKMELGREKDFKDIELIDEYLERLGRTIL